MSDDKNFDKIFCYNKMKILAVIFSTSAALSLKFIDGLPDYEDAEAILQPDDAFTQTEI